MAPNRRTAAASEVVGAGTAGGGVGTVIAAIANWLPATSGLKAPLTIAAPLLAIAVSGVWIFVKRVYVDPYAMKKEGRAQEGQLREVLERARNQLRHIQDNPATSEEHRRHVQAQVEVLEQKMMELYRVQMDFIIDPGTSPNGRSPARPSARK